MAKSGTQYVCQSCGAVSNKWSGKCESCNEWNTLVEEKSASGPPLGRSAKPDKGKAQIIELTSLAGEAEAPPRNQTGIKEFDRVIGGGFVPGSAILLGGDPGIGKSTILLQAAAALAEHGKQVVYISGEEAIAQLRMRASRLGLSEAPVKLGAETNVADILTTLKKETADVSRFDPDGLVAHHRKRTRHRLPGPGRRPGVDPSYQISRHRAGAGRTYHQRGPNRRPACFGAYG